VIGIIILSSSNMCILLFLKYNPHRKKTLLRPPILVRKLPIIHHVFFSIDHKVGCILSPRLLSQELLYLYNFVLIYSKYNVFINITFAKKRYFFTLLVGNQFDWVRVGRSHISIGEVQRSDSDLLY
jgi:hypothetical protein